MNLGLGTSAGIGEREANETLRCLAIVTSQISLPGKFKGKLTNGFLANVYSPVFQKEQIKTINKQKVRCML